MRDHPEQRQGFVERQRVDPQENIIRHLRNLPQEVRQPYDWVEFRRRARQRMEADARARSNSRWYVGIAAALVLVVAGIAVWTRSTQSNMPEPTNTAQLPPENTPASASPEELEKRADATERWLASLPSEPGVVRVGTQAAVAGLEDRIAQLDDLLSAARVEGAQPARLALLEQQRARLVNSLVQVRYAQTLVSASR